MEPRRWPAADRLQIMTRDVVSGQCWCATDGKMLGTVVVFAMIRFLLLSLDGRVVRCVRL